MMEDISKGCGMLLAEMGVVTFDNSGWQDSVDYDR